jgi:hypothetical protein
MSTKIEYFEKNLDTDYSEKIVSKIASKINTGEWTGILEGLCSIKDNAIVLDYIYFKHFATKITYSIILNHITNNIDIILSKNEKFNVHVNLKKLTLIDIDKHKEFIQDMSVYLKDKYPDKLSKCYIYNAPFVFSQIFNIVSLFIDKDTQTKIELVVKK